MEDSPHNGGILEGTSGIEPPWSHAPKSHSRTPSTPSARTGVPRSLAFISPATSRQNSSQVENPDTPLFNNRSKEPPSDPYENGSYHSQSEFRNALDYANPDQREKERETMERKERSKRHDTWLDPEVWNPRKWLFGPEDQPLPSEEPHDALSQPGVVTSSTPASHHASPLRTLNQPKSPKTPTTGGGPRWSRLRSFVTGSTHGSHPVPASSVAGTTVNITDELIAGGLSALLLRMWFERDERDARRIPILLHRLRIRVSDSLHPLQGSQSVFRIEVCASFPSPKIS